MMKGIMRILASLLFVASVLVACNEKELVGQEEGALSLKVDMQSYLPTVTTRANLTDEELLQNCKVYIRNSEGLVRKFVTLSEMPDKIQLIPNAYTAEVTAGDSVAASFTDSYYKGSTDFIIKTKETVSEIVKCKIQNAVVAIKFSDELQEAFPSYTITVSNRLGTLEYIPENIDALGYFMLLGDENQLRWNFKGQVKGTGTDIVKSGTVNLVKKSTKYVLTFSNSGSEVGGGMINVTVDESVISSDVEVGLMARPVIKLIEGDKVYDLDIPAYRSNTDQGATPIKISMAASVPFVSLKVTSDDFKRLDIDNFASFDLLKLTDTELRDLDKKGFEVTFSENYMKAEFSFGENLRKKMTQEAKDEAGNVIDNVFEFDIEVEDRNGKQRSKTLTVIATDAMVATESISNPEDVWSTKVTLYGSLIVPSASDLKFKYRERGTQEWISYDKNIIKNDANKTFSAILTGLKPGTIYEYQAASGEVGAKESKEFMTEMPIQLPNSGFEEWNGSSPLYIFKNGDDMFWDSGNTGSATMSKNVTTNDSSVKHSGSYSAKLKSQFVGVLGIGAFAAGNIFVGKFLEIDGTDGILRFGRPFDTRPSKLILYYRYTCGTIDNAKSPYESLKGKDDMADIYIALGDWQHQSYGSETDIPVLVKTKASVRQLFDSNSSNVIAFGEQVITESTEGDGFVKLEIPIKYRSNRKPTDIIVVGTASKYGDYFTGSTNSTLWLDDIELIYDDVIFEKQTNE